MANTRGSQRLHKAFSGGLLKFMGFFWGAVFLGVVLNIISGEVSALLPEKWRSFIHKPIEWIIQNPGMTVLIIIVLILMTVIAYQGSGHIRSTSTPTIEERLPDTNPVDTIPTLSLSLRPPHQPSTEKDLERRYLLRMIRETELLRLTGIPAGLVAPSVPLDNVFIPPVFLPNRLPSDYPITREEFTSYRELLKSGLFSEEMERALIGTEKIWLETLRKGSKVSIAQLWRQLTRNTPVAVIQGYPGMGKSTLLARLTLHMARCGSNQPDQSMGNQLETPRSSPLPVLLLLKDYAIELEKAITMSADLPLINYLKIAMDRLHIPGLFAFIEICLVKGRCLIMLDGLDEVSELQMRKRVKQAIETFILDNRDSSQTGFNRFLITSRVAGYDVIAFSDYLHFTLAELAPEQISDFLPCWCLASVRRGTVASTSQQEEKITREAEQMAQRLSDAVKAHQGVGQLAQNPLLLTLLVVMQQNSIELPRQRVELYTTVNRTLLENRNIAKDLRPIPETQAIQRLGPIAFQMQESGNSFARQRDVKESLRETIKQEGGLPEEIEREVEHFLGRIRERGGLFVIRTGDYFGFFHRTFQEYFAARHILHLIKSDPDAWIAALVKLVCHAGDLWREPFLLAVAYQSGEDEVVARKLIQALLDAAKGADFARQVHDLLLAAECLIEAKPLTIGAVLEKQIARQLLQIYEQAQRTRKFEVGESIEGIMQRWVLNLPYEAYRPAPLIVLVETVSNTQQIMLQRASLTLLTMIAQQLTECPPFVFDMLVPSLLALAGLPAIGKFQPDASIPLSFDFGIADLALTALSFIGKPGPSGQLLLRVRQDFKEHPGYLYQLARYSLESGTLITPVVAPLSRDNDEKYETAITQWITLRDHYQRNRIAERDVVTCLGIHEALLVSAEEAAYPTAAHLLHMLREAADHPSLPWQQAWQHYLLDQLSSGHYINYQEMALLWAMLFPDEHDLHFLADRILEHQNGNIVFIQRGAQRFIALLCNDLKDLNDLNDLNDLRQLLDLKNLKDLKDIRDLKYLRYLKILRDLKDIRHLNYLRGSRHLRDLSNLRDVRFLLRLKDLKNLRNLLLTHEVIEQAKRKLLAADSVQYVDLLTILLGRILQVQENGKMNTVIEDEIRQIVDVAIDALASKSADGYEAIEATLDIMRYLPVRSADEVIFVLQLTKDTTDRRIHTACSQSLKRANPDIPEVRTALEAGKQSLVKVIRYTVEDVLSYKK